MPLLTELFNGNVSVGQTGNLVANKNDYAYLIVNFSNSNLNFTSFISASTSTFRVSTTNVSDINSDGYITESIINLSAQSFTMQSTIETTIKGGVANNKSTTVNPVSIKSIIGVQLT